MNIRKITDSVYYVGVNDRVTERFEGLWPLPNGVSYNSYIVEGNDKIALIDTTEVATGREFHNQIRLSIGDKKLDYLVVNHMEPDHSSGIPVAVASYPELKIVGNRQTISMIKGFYCIDDDKFIEIKDGDKLDLGGKTLQFILTPMVHWPETMMTFLEEDKVLFTGDAFGTFGALNGGITDDEMVTEYFKDEMYRYYSNIVAKYGKFVEKAIDKTSGLGVEYICSTHGPVWHSKVGEVVDLYRRMARYEPENGVTIIYGSMYGNTAEVAEEIARKLAARGIKNIKIHNASKSEMSYMISDAFRYEGLIVGAPTYSMHIFPPVEQFMIAMETREIKNKVFATFGSFTWASAAQKLLGAFADKMNMQPVATLEMKQSMSDQTHKDIDALADAVAAALTK